MQDTTNEKRSDFGLYILLAALYLLFFDGLFFVTDELFLFDMTESFARRGNLDETLTYSYSWLRIPAEDNIFRSTESYEPLQPILAAPLFLIGQTLELNLIHVVWLFNIAVTPLISLVFYRGVRILGYDSQTAWWSALLLGIGTLLFSYANTYFRDPLTTLFLLTTVVAALQIQHSRKKLPWLAFVVLAVSFMLALLTKVASLLFIPLVSLLLWRYSRRNLMLVVGLGVTFMLLIVVLWQFDVSGANRFNPVRWQQYITASDLHWVYVSTTGYLFSPERGFFYFSPLFFLIPWGMWALYKRGEWRLVLGTWGTFILFVVVYGILRENVWHGGWGIGPRYLLSLVPVFMFSIVPLVDRLLHAERWLHWHYAVLAVFVVSIGVQLLFATYSQGQYFRGMVGQEFDVTDTWDMNTAPHWYMLNHINTDDILRFWRNSALWPMFTVGVLIVAGVALHPHTKHLPESVVTLTMGTLGVMLFLIALLGISIVEDERFNGTAPNTVDAIETLENADTQNSAIVLKDDRYMLPFAAQYTKDTFVTTLPFIPGEIYGPVHTPLVSDGTTAELVGHDVVVLYDYIASRYERVWLVTYFDSFHTFAKRPEERYLAENYYPLDRMTISQDMHLVEFYMQPVPEAPPAITTDITFDEQLRLQGYDLPNGTQYSRGDFLPVVLQFGVEQPMYRDYTLSVMLADASGAVVAQHDAFPIGGFERMSQWQNGETYRDARALEIPENLPHGTYTLQTIIYYWETLERLPVTDASGNSPADIAILQTIEVR